MKAVYLTAKGDPEALVYGDVAQPTPAAGEVLVQVSAAAVTPSELDWRTTWEAYEHQPRQFPIILGHEFSGVVAALGPGVAGVAAGDPVYGVNDFISSGAQAEYVVAKAGELAPRPRTLDHVHAAMVPISAMTAWQSLFDHGGLRAGQRVLIQGAAGAVGSFAVQLARWSGAYTIATATGAGLELARSLGADEVIDYRAVRFEDVVREIDLAFDTVGADTGERTLPVLRRGGKLVPMVAG